VIRYPWRAAAIICANSVQAKLKLLETSTAEKLSATRDRGGPTRGYVLAHAAALAASMSRELDPSYEKAHHRLAMAEEACGDGERAEHAPEILADIRMYRDHTAKIVAAGQLKVRADLSYDAYEPSERMWPARLISYQVGLISARSLWHWGNRDLPRVFEFLRAHTSGPLHLRCSLVELDNTYSLARQGIHVKDEDKNRYGSYEKGGQWLSIGLNTGDNTPRSTLVQLEQVWFVRCDTTGAAALDGPLAYAGGTDMAIRAAEAQIDAAASRATAEGFHVGSVLLAQGLEALKARRGHFGASPLDGIAMPDLGHVARTGLACAAMASADLSAEQVETMMERMGTH